MRHADDVKPQPAADATQKGPKRDPITRKTIFYASLPVARGSGRRGAGTTASPLLHILHALNGPILADLHAFEAAGALPGVRDYRVPVKEEVDFSDNRARAGLDALPAGLARARVETDEAGAFSRTPARGPARFVFRARPAVRCCGVIVHGFLSVRVPG